MTKGSCGKKTRWLAVFCAWTVLLSAGLWAAQTTPTTRDTLVYKDGDRVQGKLVSESATEIVFKADRFGEVRVHAGDAVVIKAEKPGGPIVAESSTPAPAAAATKPAATPPVTPTEKKNAVAAEEKEEEEKLSIWDRFSPAVLTAKVRNFFGPWHGRVSFSTEVVSDVADRTNSSYETHLARKWKADDVQINARFDYAEANNVTTTDMIKTSAQWRHDFNKQVFAQYRPSTEWNRASTFRGLPNDYVLLQQELGMGYQFLTKPTRKLRAGVSQNLFDTWNTAPGSEHTSRGVVSTFEEAELTMPWRITVSQRGVWYPVRAVKDGWENRFEVNKKLTETLSTSIRHEIRRNNPDGTSQDYTRLKLLFGLDF